MRRLIVPMTLLAAACGSKSGVDGGARPPHVVEGCSPLAIGSSTTGAACVMPFPNAWFEESSSTTATGVSIDFPSGALPVNNVGKPLLQSSLGPMDGFSPATPLIAWVPNGVNSSQLTLPENIADSLSSSNPIALVDLSTMQRVPFFSEVDANSPNTGRHALLIHPMVRLSFSTRYAVAITTALQDSDGDALAPDGDFALWVQGKLPNTSRLAQIADRLDADAAAFESLGIPKSSLALAWDFDTASDSGTTSMLFNMVSEALQNAPEGLGYTLNPTTMEDGGFEVITGNFDSPSFEDGPDPALLNYDSNGNPVMGSAAPFDFIAVVPPCVASAPGPVPLAVIGHGLFSTAEEELTADEPLLQDLCMVGIGAEFLGLTESDFVLIGEKVLTDVNNFGLVTDRLMQSHVNFQVLTRLAKNALASDPAFAVNGKGAYDPSTVYYWGASNGGIQGATYLALSSDVSRALLNVPGAEWSLLIWRSADFAPAAAIFAGTYPDPMDQQLLLSISQSKWDRTDPIEFAPHIQSGKFALFQQSMGDAMVTNIATELEMRTIGAKGLAPLISDVFGITADAGPTDQFVYTQWSVDPTPLPGDTDVPPQANTAHNDVRWLPDAIAQMKQFLQPNGQAVNTCGGTCVFPGE